MSVERLLWQSFALSPTFLAHSWLDSGYEARIRTRNTNTTGLPSTLLLLQYLPCSWLLLSTPPPCPRKWQLDPLLTAAVSSLSDSLETWILTMMVSLMPLIPMMITMAFLMTLTMMMTMMAFPMLLIMTMMASLTTWTFLVMKGNGDSDLDLDLLFSAWSF